MSEFKNACHKLFFLHPRFTYHRFGFGIDGLLSDNLEKVLGSRLEVLRLRSQLSTGKNLLAQHFEHDNRISFDSTKLNTTAIDFHTLLPYNHKQIKVGQVGLEVRLA